MKKILVILFGSFLISSNVNAESFSSALSKAFKNNSELNAERENINISEQELKISKGNYLPTVTLSGSKSQEDTNKLTNQSGGNASISDVDPLTKSISISQTLIDFGRGAELSKSQIDLELAKAKLLKKEQDILYKTTEAYTGLILANEKLNINRDNVELLSRQVETDQIRVERGQITLSDASQSESSLAEAQAKLIQAENELLTSKLNYENIIGSLNNPKSLDKNSILEYPLPESLSSTYDEREKDTIKATVSWPFYSGGKNRASLNKSSSLETRSRLILDSVTKQNQTNVASAWSNYQSNKSLLNSVQAQVRAAEIANEGIAAEYNSGAGRTTLEVIQSNSLLLNAQISLANSERNYILSQFNLLKSIGLLHSEYLKIN